MGDPSGFDFRVTGVGRDGVMGDERPWVSGQQLEIRSPLPATIRLIRDGQVEAVSEGESLDHPVTRAGVYRVELWLPIGGERRPWLYSNPIYLRPGR
jgi:hypothetical protein